MKTSSITNNKTKPMKTSALAFAAIVQTPVYPKTLHQFRPGPKAAATSKPPKREKTFSKSRDLHEDRGTREMKTSHGNQTNHAR